MAGSITPLPVLAEFDEEDRKRYEELKAPSSIVVRYGYMRMIAELPYRGEAKPGCGSKLVIRTNRGIELGEMLTTTCGNSGCGKSVSRKQMLTYIENSGGKQYPFTSSGKVLRVATVEDLNDQSRLDDEKVAIVKRTKEMIAERDLPMRLVDVERLLGGERIIFHYTSEDWVDFRELVREMASEFQTRIEMHQVNDRDESRIVADYEKCGQHCCCKQFLKVLKPVSMKSAKIQKATLDPQKISGRCGRLMCCLRYEDETYDSLRKSLPHRKTPVMSDDGPGIVINTQILTQLVLVRLETGVMNAYPVESLRKLDKEEASAMRQREVEQRASMDARKAKRGEPRRPSPGRPLRDEEVESKEGGVASNEGNISTLPSDRKDSRKDGQTADRQDDRPQSQDEPQGQGGGDSGSGGSDVRASGEGRSGGESTGQGQGQSQEQEQGEGGGKKRRRRRRRRRGGGGGSGGGEGGGGG